jgi:hypothetical protein
MGRMEVTDLLTNDVLAVLRRSLRRHFPIVRDDKFNSLLHRLEARCREYRSR